MCGVRHFLLYCLSFCLVWSSRVLLSFGFVWEITSPRSFCWSNVKTKDIYYIILMNHIISSLPENCYFKQNYLQTDSVLIWVVFVVVCLFVCLSLYGRKLKKFSIRNNDCLSKEIKSLFFFIFLFFFFCTNYNLFMLGQLCIFWLTFTTSIQHILFNYAIKAFHRMGKIKEGQAYTRTEGAD